MLADLCLSMRLLKQVLSFALDFFLNLWKNDLNTVFGRNLFSIANDCFVNLLKLLNTRMNNLYVEGFDDYVITEMINMLCNK